MTTYTYRELIAMYDDMLDECYDTIEIAGMSYCPSKVLEDVDPIAYDCGFNDYVDSLGIDLDEVEQ